MQTVPRTLLAGAAGRCPECGKGKLYKSYLKIADRCAVCGADLSVADSGDGPAVFVMFVVGAIVVPFAFILQFGVGWSVIASVLAAGALTVVLSLALLPPFKGVLFAAQWANKAGEGRLR